MVLHGRRGRSIQCLRGSLWWMEEVSRLGWYVLLRPSVAEDPNIPLPRLGDRPNKCPYKYMYHLVRYTYGWGTAIPRHLTTVELLHGVSCLS